MVRKFAVMDSQVPGQGTVHAQEIEEHTDRKMPGGKMEKRRSVIYLTTCSKIHTSSKLLLRNTNHFKGIPSQSNHRSLASATSFFTNLHRKAVQTT
jgi:hypothetical protein